jgi:hypothetical protein
MVSASPLVFHIMLAFQSSYIKILGDGKYSRVPDFHNTFTISSSSRHTSPKVRNPTTVSPGFGFPNFFTYCPPCLIRAATNCFSGAAGLMLPVKRLKTEPAKGVRLAEE